VRGVRDEREAACEPARDGLDQCEAAGQEERDPKNAFVVSYIMVVVMPVRVPVPMGATVIVIVAMVVMR